MSEVLVERLRSIDQKAGEIERLYRELKKDLEEFDRQLTDLLASEAGILPEIVDDHCFYVSHCDGTEYYLMLKEGRLAVLFDHEGGEDFVWFSKWLERPDIEDGMAYVRAASSLIDFLHTVAGELEGEDDPRLRSAARKLRALLTCREDEEAVRGGV